MKKLIFLFLAVQFSAWAQTENPTAANKEYTNNQIEWLKRYTDAEIKSVREAVDKVETTNTAKFEAQNEWRGQMKDQTSEFVTRRELWTITLPIFVLVVGNLVNSFLSRTRKIEK